MKKELTVWLEKREGIYYGRWRDGKKEVKRSLRTRVPEEAQRLAAALEAEMRERMLVKAQGWLAWGKAWRDYERHFATTKAIATLEQEAVVWKRCGEWLEKQGVTRWVEVSPAVLGKWRDALISTCVHCGAEAEVPKTQCWQCGRPWRALSRSTANQYLVLLGVVWGGLAKLGLQAGENPVRRVDRFRKSSSQHTRVWLTESEVKTLLKVAADRSDDMFLVCLLGIFEGLRSGEIQAMRWDWVHWPESDGETGCIKIPAEDEWFRPTNRTSRTVPMHQRVFRELLERRPASGVARAYVVAPLDQSVVRGKRSCFQALFQKVVKEAGISKHIKPNTLRHTFASRGVRLRVDPCRLLEWLGHSNLKLLMEIHSQLELDDREICNPFTE